MGRVRKSAPVVLVFAVLALTSSARGAAVYDEEDLGAGVPIGINSVGAVLLGHQDCSSGPCLWTTFEVVGPDGTRHSTSIPAGWDALELKGITDPRPSAPLGVAWGQVTRSDPDERAPVVWNPPGEVTQVSVPAGATFTEARGVGADGWLYCLARTLNLPQTVYWRGAAFACRVEQPELRVDAPLISGSANVDLGFLGRDAGRAVLYAYDDSTVYGQGYLGTRLWDPASGTLTDPGYGASIVYMDSAGESLGYDDPTGHFGALVFPSLAVWSATGIRSILASSAKWGTQISNGWVIGVYEQASGAEGCEYYGNSYFTAPTVMVWHVDGRVFDLTEDIQNAGGVAALPNFVTADGLVVGEMGMYPYGSQGPAVHPFVWDAENGLVDLTPDYVGEAWFGGSVIAVSRQGKVFYNDWAGGVAVAWQRVDGIGQSSPLSLTNGWSPWGAGTTFFPDWMVQFTNDLGQYVSTKVIGGELRVAVATPRGSTQPGTDVLVAPDANTSITFGGIVTPGETTVVAYDIDDPDAPTVPADFSLAGTDTLINISTTATFDGAIHLAIHYDDTGMSAARESQIRLLHFEDPQWVDVTDYARAGGYLDTVNDVVYGVTTSLSPFAVAVRDYVFGGFESPVNADGSSIFKAGKTVPLKFTLTEPDGTAITGATARLRILKDSAAVLGTVDEVEWDGATTEGDLFESTAGGKYHFNLKTTGLSAGTYRADAVLDDGSTFSVTFSLR